MSRLPDPTDAGCVIGGGRAGPSVLFITANRLGDAVLSCGLLDHIARTHAGGRITVACGPVAQSLFRGLPGLERVLPIAKRKRSGHWIALWRAVATRRWDLVVDLRASVLAWTLRARRRVIAGKAAPDLHRVETLGRLIGLDPPPPPVLWSTPADAAAAAARLPADGPPVLGIGPAANWRGKQWRGARFAETVARLTAADGVLPGARIAVFAAADERDQCRPVLDAVPPARLIDLVGAVDPLQAHACLSHCALYIGNDSGLMHLAAAAGIPTLGLFGPSRPEHYRPWGARAAYIRTDLAYDDLVGGPGYDHRTTGTLMDSLSVERVTAAAAALLRHDRP